MVDLRVDFIEFAPDHQVNNLAKVGALHRPRTDRLSVAQDAITIGHALAFLQKMTDVNDADSTLLEAFNRRDQILGIQAGVGFAY